MGDKKELEKPTSAEDPELDELLDSALEDFTKKPAAKGAASEAKPSESEAEGAVTTADKSEAEWADEFIKQAAAQFETNMASLLGGGDSAADVSPEQIQANLQRMAEAAAQVMTNPAAHEPTPQSNDFAAAISQTLQGLSLGAENLQNPFSENDLMSMFGGGVGGVGAGAGGPEAKAFLPFMQGMMQSLLSKEVLYPSLRDILERYPAWLDEHRAALPAADLERYTAQQALMRDVCAELEQEQPDDEDAVKRERFDRVLQLMQKMQDLGHPPAELVGDSGPGLQFDAQGNPMLPPDLGMADPNQCSLM